MKITLQNVERKFAQWRSSKNKGKFPEELLKLASACASMYGKTKTATALNISGVKVNYAMQMFPFLEEKKESKNLDTPEIVPDMNFFEIKFQESQNELKLDPSIQNKQHEFYHPLILYELENKYGVKLRVFSESEYLQKAIFRTFSLGS
jgi:hypothetical protein